MSKTSAWAYDIAEQAIDVAIDQIKKGADKETTIKLLLEDSNVTGFFDAEEINMIIDFELQDRRMYSNIVTKEIQ
ncbi:hypothetical protein [uncultured Mediterranean phage uvMED]|nr:hypothetical protein [uncultured Mediterranean phage uvMED]|tara:strand:- start:378 stop:602 length:225 start_codon:yes stop_codon:yes gene_type:complete